MKAVEQRAQTSALGRYLEGIHGFRFVTKTRNPARICQLDGARVGIAIGERDRNPATARGQRSCDRQHGPSATRTKIENLFLTTSFEGGFDQGAYFLRDPELLGREPQIRHSGFAQNLWHGRLVFEFERVNSSHVFLPSGC